MSAAATVLGIVGVSLCSLALFAWWIWDSVKFLRFTLYRRVPTWRAIVLATRDIVLLLKWQRFALSNKAIQLFAEYSILKPKPGVSWGFEPSLDQDKTQRSDEIEEIRAWCTARIRFVRDEQDPCVSYSTCFDLHEVIDGIKEYAEALHEMERRAGKLPSGFYPELITRIRILDGYCAPVYLLGGLLPEFDKQWPLVIGKYGELMSKQMERDLPHESGQDDRSSLEKARSRLCGPQLYQFFCWLIWGPSVPICKCSQWGDLPLMQYGYGDEDNSILLNLNELQLDRLRNDWQDVGNSIERQTPLAHRLSVRGKLEIRSHFDSPTTPRAQQPQVGAVAVLNVIDTPPLAQAPEFKAQRYYGAYLWVMLWICREDDERGYDGLWRRSEEWRNLLPYFVHGNLAEWRRALPSTTARSWTCPCSARTADP